MTGHIIDNRTFIQVAGMKTVDRAYQGDATCIEIYKEAKNISAAELRELFGGDNTVVRYEPVQSEQSTPGNLSVMEGVC